MKANVALIDLGADTAWQSQHLVSLAVAQCHDRVFRVTQDASTMNLAERLKDIQAISPKAALIAWRMIDQDRCVPVEWEHPLWLALRSHAERQGVRDHMLTEADRAFAGSAWRYPQQFGVITIDQMQARRYALSVDSASDRTTSPPERP